jgi:hypothetical protein
MHRARCFGVEIVEGTLRRSYTGLVAVLQANELAEANGLASQEQLMSRVSGDRLDLESMRRFVRRKPGSLPGAHNGSKRGHWIQCGRQEKTKFAEIPTHREDMDVICYPCFRSDSVEIFLAAYESDFYDVDGNCMGNIFLLKNLPITWLFWQHASCAMHR